MSTLFELREQGSGCASDLLLYRTLAGEPLADRERAHLAGCGRCVARLQALRDGKEEHDRRARSLGAAATLHRAARPAARPRRARWLAPMGALAAAALLVLLWPRDHAPERAGAPATRLKGGERFSVLVEVAGGGFERLAPGRLLAPGTRLGFELGCGDRCAVTIHGLGERGAPYTIVASERLEAGPLHALALTVELDDADGSERLFAFFCDAVPAPADVHAALARAYPADRRQLAREVPVDVAGCRVRSIRVERT